MAGVVEIHGKAGCPFTWRARIAAHEKGVAFDHVLAGAVPPDPRAARNVSRRSPLLVHGDVELAESFVIIQYLDEAFAGPSLQPADPLERARMRQAVTEIVPIPPTLRPGVELDDEIRGVIAGGHDAHERWLRAGDGYVIGGRVTLADIHAWPFLALVAAVGIDFTQGRPRLAEHWERIRHRPSFLETRPAWARLMRDRPPGVFRAGGERRRNTPE